MPQRRRKDGARKAEIMYYAPATAKRWGKKSRNHEISPGDDEKMGQEKQKSCVMPRRQRKDGARKAEIMKYAPATTERWGKKSRNHEICPGDSKNNGNLMKINP